MTRKKTQSFMEMIKRFIEVISRRSVVPVFVLTSGKHSFMGVNILIEENFQTEKFILTGNMRKLM